MVARMATLTPDASWTPRGTMHVWRYLVRPTKRSAGWQFACDREAYASLAGLLDKFRAADATRMRTIPLVQPTRPALAVTRTRPSYKPRGLSALKLIYRPAAEADHWRLEEHENTLELEMGKSSFEEFALAVAAMREGDGNFAIGDPPLRFWWYRHD